MPKVPAVTYNGPGIITGPEGELIAPGEPIPKTWPLEVRQALYDSGATTKTRPPAGPTVALEDGRTVAVTPAVGEAVRVGPDAGMVATAHRSQRQEVPWPAGDVEAVLSWSEPGTLGHLTFVDPKGRRHSVPVTTGPTEDRGGFGNVWHVDVDGEVATVSPSVHYVGEWHTPNPVRFALVPELGVRQ